MIFNYTDLGGDKKRIELPVSSHNIYLDWVGGFGVHLCYDEKNDFKHVPVNSKAKESDLDYFKSQFTDQIEEVLKVPDGKFRCKRCGDIHTDDDPLEIEFMEKARKKFGEDVKRESLIKVCDQCSVEMNKPNTDCYSWG